jgi:Uncharacterized protein conserved in bacteria
MENATTMHTVTGHKLGLVHAAIFLCATAMLLFASVAPGQAAAPKDNTTRIVSEKMTHDANKNQVVFEGKVHVVRPTMEIWSDVLTVILDNSDKKQVTPNNTLGSGGKVDKIIAEKNVRIKQENKSGTCGKATYYVNAGKIIMEQSPVLIDGDNRISGRVINYFTQTGKSEVIGNVDVQFSTDNNSGPVFLGASPASDDAGGKVQQ